MLHSMTGFARETAETEIGTLTWEIRAVNHRYLDVQFKMPDEMRPKEQVFRQKVSHALGHGKVECALYYRRAHNLQSELQLNDGMVALLGTRIAALHEKISQLDDRKEALYRLFTYGHAVGVFSAMFRRELLDRSGLFDEDFSKVLNPKLVRYITGHPLQYFGHPIGYGTKTNFRIEHLGYNIRNPVRIGPHYLWNVVGYYEGDAACGDGGGGRFCKFKNS